MATDNTTQERLMEDRAKAIATIMLTRRPELRLTQPPDGRESGYDFEVEIVEGNKRSYFFIEVRSVWAPLQKSEVDIALQPYLAEAQTSRPLPFPSCIFLFTMKTNQCWFCWVTEPCIKDGRAFFRVSQRADAQRLDDRLLDQVLTSVTRWFDVYYANVNMKE